MGVTKITIVPRSEYPADYPNEKQKGEKTKKPVRIVHHGHRASERKVKDEANHNHNYDYGKNNSEYNPYEESAIIPSIIFCHILKIFLEV
jgi:hypothetical protein